MLNFESTNAKCKFASQAQEMCIPFPFKIIGEKMNKESLQIQKIELLERLQEIIEERKMIDFMLRENKADSLLNL